MIGRTVLQYTILEKLGEGGMGVVYKAQDTKLDRFVALKFLPHHLSGSESERDRLLHEAKAAAALNHPNVCSVIDIQEFDDQQFIIMEYVDGTTLRQKIPIPKFQDAIHYAIQVGEALQLAHSKGIIHRDVKTENIMMTSDGRIKVMDFGLAKLKGTLKLTKTSSTVGTLGYMAPEQLQGGTVDARSDIFSLGVVLFELLTGASPFRGEHEAAMMYSIVNEDPESVLKYNSEINPELDRIIHRALEKDPADRYQHVDDLLSELRRLQKNSTRVVRPDELQESSSFRSVRNVESPPRGTMTRTVIAASSVLVVAIAVWLFFFNSSFDTISSMAVLPFVNAGTDQSTEYLSDGITESLINSLSKIPGVKMMSRNSVFRHKGKEVDPQVVGKELNVDAVVLGRIHQRDEALDVSVELVKVSDNSHLWGAQYHRKSSELISLQNEISTAISRHLNNTITADQEKAITKNSTENTKAYQLYLKGRFFLNKRTTEGFQKAQNMFQQAIELDPGYALAYSGLADCYVLLSTYLLLPPSEAYPKAKAAALKAIELDPTMAEPHSTLAGVESEYHWNFEAGEREFRKSIELNPNYATSHQWFGEYLLALGRLEEAEILLLKAIEIDPLAPVIYTALSKVYIEKRNFNQAISFLQRALDLDPHFPRAYYKLAEVQIRQENYKEALNFAKEALKYSGNGLEYRTQVGFIYGKMGRRSEAEKILNELFVSSKKEFVSPILIASMYAGIGDKENAFKWLEQCYQDHSGELIYIRIEPTFDTLHDDPRYTALLKKIGLPI